MQPLRNMSLTRRLTWLFVLVSTAVLLTLGFFIANSVEKHFEDLDMEALSGKMTLTRHALHAITSATELVQLQARLGHSMVGHSGLELMVLERDGTVVYATENAHFDPALVLASASPSPFRPVLWTQGGQTYRAIIDWLDTGMINTDGAPQRLLVAVASNTAHHQLYVESILQTLWVFVAGAAALTGLLGWLVVRQSLAPLAAMREKAQVVTARQLSHRLSVDRVPKELAELAQSLNDMLARLEDAFARLSDFSSDIAHELRTPVCNLMTQTQVALSRARSADDYRAVLESNAEEFERMGRMISDMLLLAKADNGLVVPNREAVNLADEVRALFEYYEAVAGEKQLQLVLQGAAEVLADRLMLRRALANLLSNAVRHATPGSIVQIVLSSTADGVTVAVENSGDTIAPEHLGRIFDRFFRVDPSRQRNAEGTGLGLAITQSIIAAHGGRITATSANGTTTLCITLNDSQVGTS